MTSDRLLVIMAQVTAKYPNTIVEQSNRVAGGTLYHELVIVQGDKIIAYVDIDSGVVHAQPGIEL